MRRANVLFYFYFHFSPICTLTFKRGMGGEEWGEMRRKKGITESSLRAFLFLFLLSFFSPLSLVAMGTNGTELSLGEKCLSQLPHDTTDN